MAPPQIDFRAAFDRWTRVCATEKLVVDARMTKGETLVAREALDHLCGLAVEVGMKHILIKKRFVTADRTGDYPADVDGRRPHVDTLWDVFMSKAQGRVGADLVKALGGTSQVPVFQTWKSANRYAPDDTVVDAEVKPRLKFLERLRGVIVQDDV